MNYINIAKNSIKEELKQIEQIVNHLDEDFNKAVIDILKCKGRVIIIGMGKSGLVGSKIAASLASTGTPSFFVHPGEAMHGDLGMICPEDVLILISYSGETSEVLQLIPSIEKFGNTTIAITGNPKSTLAKFSNYHLNVKIEKEVCPMNLAPTTSTSATMIMGDAIVVALIEARCFEPQDFGKFHPGGSLGKKVLEDNKKNKKGKK